MDNTTPSSSRQPSRPASAIDIPTQRLPATATYGTVSSWNFVSSPGNVDYEQTPGPHTALFGSNSAIHSRGATDIRPSLGSRSVSTPHHLPTRRRANTTSHRTSKFSRTQAHTPREQQWSLFGQLMENEGQLRSPTISAYRRSTRKSQLVPDDSENISARSSVFDSALTSDVQSPMQQEQDPFLNPAPIEHSSDDSETESEESSSSSTDTLMFPSTATTSRSRWNYIPDKIASIPVLYRNLFKCALAYFIASLFTYNEYLSSFISDLTTYGPGEHVSLPSGSGHMVATVAVYYQPAKTMGAMVEADLFCFFGLFYAAFTSLSCIAVYRWLELHPGLEWFGDVLVIFWLGLCMSWLAWMKIWMANPQFSTACSMISIIIFVVIVREGGLLTLLEVTFIVIVGSSVSNVVCYVVWPQTATANLQTNMTKTLDSFSTLLTLITQTFLLEEGPHQPSLEKIQRATESHQNSFTGLKKNLKEAKREWYFWPRSAGDRDTAYEDAVDSLNRLGQHLNGLRSGTRLQYELTRAGVVGRNTRRAHRKANGKSPLVDIDNVDDEAVIVKAAASMFGDLVDDLGPPLKALSVTCTSSLKRLRESFVQSQQRRGRKQNLMQPEEFHQLVRGIEKALLQFESTSNHAVLRLYRKSIVPSTPMGESMDSMSHVYGLRPSDTAPSIASQADNAILLAAENEHVFLVYFFIFTLQEFSRELTLLIDAMERIYTIEQQSVGWSGFWHQVKCSFTERWSSWRKGWSWKWKWWQKNETLPTRPKPSLPRKLSAYMKQESPNRPRPFFPKVRPHAPDTIQTPSRSNLTSIGRLKQTLWTVGKRLSERDAKHAIRTGMGLAMLAAPAFFDGTREYFMKWWGDWALISFFVVMSPTIGATNWMAAHRVLGTLLGAAVAAGVYTLFPENAVVLSVFGFFFSFPCFYLIVGNPKYASPGRFILLAYNLTCLFCYNKRQLDLPVIYVAYHRSAAVIVGVAWAAIVSRFWWPAEARRELSKVLSEFCLNIGWLYTRLVASNSFSPVFHDEEESAPTDRTPLLSPANTRLHNSIQEFMAMELHLQIKLIELQGLLAQTQNEPRLKGPFPIKLYRGILTSLQTILDRLHSMRCVTTREEWYTSVRQDFIIPVNRERRDMVGNIILYFSVLSSAFRLKAPLPPYLPPAERSRQHLVEAIRKLDVVRNRDVKGSRQLLFFAYALTMKGVTDELESLGRTLQDAFGVIGQSPEEFEALFVDSESRLSYQY